MADGSEVVAGLVEALANRRKASVHVRLTGQVSGVNVEYEAWASDNVADGVEVVARVRELGDSLYAEMHTSFEAYLVGAGTLAQTLNSTAREVYEAVREEYPTSAPRPVAPPPPASAGGNPPSGTGPTADSGDRRMMPRVWDGVLSNLPSPKNCNFGDSGYALATGYRWQGGEAQIEFLNPRSKWGTGKLSPKVAHVVEQVFRVANTDLLQGEYSFNTPVYLTWEAGKPVQGRSDPYVNITGAVSVAGALDLSSVIYPANAHVVYPDVNPVNPVPTGPDDNPF